MAEIWMNVELDDFDDDSLVREMQSRGYVLFYKGDRIAGDDDIDRVEHLLICGQVEAAKEHACKSFERFMQRRFPN